MQDTGTGDNNTDLMQTKINLVACVLTICASLCLRVLVLNVNTERVPMMATLIGTVLDTEGLCHSWWRSSNALFKCG